MSISIVLISINDPMIAFLAVDGYGGKGNPLVCGASVERKYHDD